jgi:NADH dehydrogenase
MRVIIVGAGFGGLEAAKKLAGKPVSVLLIDRNNYHLFTPLLYQVASSLLNASDIAQPIRGIFRRQRNLRFRRAEVRGIDLGGRKVTIDTGENLPYDFLVLAAGSTTNYFGLSTVEEHAEGLKDLPEALGLRNHILTVLEKASTMPAADSQEWLTFVIVGGGPSGVEYAGALSELIRGVLPHEYPELHGRRIRIVLVEGVGEVLPPFPANLGAAAHRELARKGVEVITGARVTDAGDSVITLSNGEKIATRTLVWAAGVRPSWLAAALGSTLSKSGRVEVDDYLRIRGQRNAFATGDIASFVQDGHEVPMLSAPAMQQARVAAKNILHSIANEPLERFRYRDKGTMATIGKNSAVAKLGPLGLTGFLGWVTWLTVHLYYIIGFRNRISVLMGWAWDYFHSDRPVRLITRAN